VVDDFDAAVDAVNDSAYEFAERAPCAPGSGRPCRAA
jgi:hypothetical protein